MSNAKRENKPNSMRGAFSFFIALIVFGGLAKLSPILEVMFVALSFKLFPGLLSDDNSNTIKTLESVFIIIWVVFSFFLARKVFRLLAGSKSKEVIDKDT